MNTRRIGMPRLGAGMAGVQWGGFLGERAPYAIHPYREELPVGRLTASIKTRDGICPGSVFTPAEGSGPWPGVIFFMDGFGIRPAMWEMGQRLADGGYLVLLPDLYYRMGSYGPLVPSEAMANPKLREGFMKFVTSLDRDRKISDAEAFVEFLGARADVKGDRFGATGYCLGGNVALTAAGGLPGRFAAVASFHGGGLATDQADSPHLFVRNITGGVYVGGAMEDAHFTVEQKKMLEDALSEAGVKHTVEIYPARHGFAVPDQGAYDAAAAERHWAALFGLLRENLSPGAQESGA